MLAFAHGLILFVLAVLDSLNVKLGMLAYAEFAEAAMAVEFLVELRADVSTLIYPIILVGVKTLASLMPVRQAF